MMTGGLCKGSLGQIIGHLALCLLAVRGFSRIDRALVKKMNAGGISAAWVAPVLMASPSALKLVKYRPRARGIFSSLFAGCCRLQQHHFGVHL